jgi:FrmR/RcnR family transcriptional regulator, repressor of frmRAB operon
VGEFVVAHTARENQKLLARIRRISGQVTAIEKALLEEQGCSAVLQLIASCRGAMSGLISEFIEGHIRCHVIEENDGALRANAGSEVIEVLKSYLR